jgi:serine/threonine protein kinase
VALKVLPATLAHDREFVARFLREARAVARLNHPNIVHIYDTGVADGQYYIAMEYLEGGSLQERLHAGRASSAEALRVLTHVSRALDYAHGQGMIHRDIKPSNILFSADPRRVSDAVAKVTDFGLVRAADGLELTRSGIIMGTPEYMAPEQAEGREVDYRADLYALGLVLYQMLTGQSAFRRSTPHATLHAVIYEQPPLPSQFRPGLPAATETVLNRALAKRPEDRYQSGRALRRAYRSSLQTTEQGPYPRRKRSPLPWILTGIAAVLAVLLGLLLVLSSSTDGDGAPIASETSPIVIATATIVGSPATQTQPGTPGVEPGSPPPLQPSAIPETNTPAPPSAATMAATGTSSPPASTPTLPTNTPLPPTSTPASATTTPEPPAPVPAARFGRLAFTSNRDGNPEIYLAELDNGSVRRLTENPANDWLPDWSPDGSRIAFTSHRQGGYDLWSMNSSGGGLTLLVATGAWDDYARWDAGGRRLAFSTTADNNSEIHVRQANGSVVRLTYTGAENQWPDWSPDGQVIYTEGSKGSAAWDIYTVSGNGGQGQLWLGGPSCDVQPTWSPDGRWVAFLRILRDTNGNGTVDEEDGGEVWVGRANGTDLRRLTANIWARTPSWSPDSQWIAFTQLRDSNGNKRSDGQDASDIWAVQVGGGEAVPLIQSPYRDGDQSWTR